MPGRSAGEDRDPVHGRELRIADLHLFEEHFPRVLRDAPENRLACGGRLLEDLLEHEMLVARLLGHDRIPEDALRRLGNRAAEEVGELDAGPRDDGHLLVAEEHDVARMHQDRGDVRGDEEFPVAEPDDDGRAITDRDDFAGIVG